MDTKQFLAEFKNIASAPNGIKVLRALILNLAVSGRLTVQDVREQSSAFLEDIYKKQEELHVQGDIRENKKLRPVSIDAPWELPANWAWVRFGTLCWFAAGRTPSRKEGQYWNTGDYPWFSIADLVHGKTICESSETVSETAKRDVFKCEPVKAGSLLMSFKLSIGKLSVLGVDAFHNEAIIAIHPFDQSLQSYFFKCLNAFDLTKENKAAIKGQTLNQDSISNILIALPPREEIPRIVAKVDELMTLCDKLQAQQEEQKALCKLTRTVVLEALTSANPTEHFSEAWARVGSNMKLLLNSPESVEDFRNAIMKLAVWGRLTKRTRADARALLEDSRKHKERLVAEGKVKRGKPLTRIKEQPVRLPENWTWARFSEIGLFARGKSKHRPRNDPRLFSNGQYPFVQTGDVARSVGKGISTFSKSYNDAGLKQSQLWPNGTLCITIAANIAESAILKIDACFPDSVVGFLPFEPVGNVEYFDLFVRTAKQELASYAPATAQKNINLGILEQVAVPLPPRDEMDDIVNTTAKLLLLCDTIEHDLTKAREVSKVLAGSTISAITGIRIEEKEKMKAPKTELISTLRINVSPTNGEQSPLTAILAQHQGELSAKVLWNNSGLDIDAFYQQLKTEMEEGWIEQPDVAYMKEVEIN